MKELEIEALKENLPTVLDMITQQLEAAECPMKIQMQIEIAVEEIFVNIANYAYPDKTGKAKIQIDILENPNTAAITFLDQGIPYDPLKKPDPDVSLSAEDRQIGGLGIFMVKKSMDDMQYKYENNQNILILKKCW